MSSKTKTRWIIPVGGIDRELFSARDQGGDIRVLIKLPMEIDLEANKLTKVSSQHFSIHQSKSAQFPSTTITQTINYDGGHTKSTSALVRTFAGQLCWPFFAARLSSLADERYISNFRTRDRLIRIDEYDPNFSILVIFLFVTSKDVLKLPIYDRFFTSSTGDFSRFLIHCVHSHINLPSPQQGGFLYPSTSEPIINGKKGEFHFSQPSWTVTAPHFEPTFLKIRQALSSQLWKSVKVFLEGMSPDHFSHAEFMSRTFTKRPIVTSATIDNVRSATD